MNVSELSKSAELALAAYATLTTDSLESQTPALVDAGLTATRVGIASQADTFSSSYDVVAQYADTLANGGMGTGLNATVFSDATGKLTLAIRSTRGQSQHYFHKHASIT